MGCPICGKQGACAHERHSTRTVLIDSEPPNEDFSAAGDGLQPALYADDQMWREEVASRVDAFCARRGRKRVPRTPSLSLDFERAARATVAAHYAVPEPQVDPIPSLPQEPAPEASNLLEFPRPVPLPPPPLLEPVPYVDELAEPIIEKPRILDAEEPSGLQFGGQSRPSIALETQPDTEPHDDAAPVAESATLSRRIFAGTVDAVLVMTAAAMFAAIFLHMNGMLPRSRSSLGFALGLPVLLWMMYQYLFLVHAAATPGMRVARLRITDFEGVPARRGVRRWRAVAMALSALALGMGFFWAAIDECELCWHDRVTRTFLRRG
jgi:uncharacterized RDD family membrane protein YckC